MKIFSIKNELAELPTLLEEIHSFCVKNGASESSCFDVRLGAEEAITNTIKYGYDDSGIHIIRVSVEARDHRLILEIEDDGREFNPLQQSDPDLSLPIEQKPIGGLGIHLMRKVMDSIEYQRSGMKNILRMTKSIKP